MRAGSDAAGATGQPGAPGGELRSFIAAALSVSQRVGVTEVLARVARHLSPPHGGARQGWRTPQPARPVGPPATPGTADPDVDPRPLPALGTTDADPYLRPPPALRRPELLGVLYEALMDRTERRSRGAFYTPEPVGATLCAETLGPLLGAGASPPTLAICDPAVGSGALLLAASRFLLGRGAQPAAIADSLAGRDVDPLAVAVARTALGILLGVEPTGITVGDSLRAPWATDRFDAVVTNPPFLGQLKTLTVRGDEERAGLIARYGPAAGGYCDDAGLFLLLAMELVRPGGRIGIILPEPLLTTRDGQAVRRSVGQRSRLEGLEIVPAVAFAAGIRTRAAILERTDGGRGDRPGAKTGLGPPSGTDPDSPAVGGETAVGREAAAGEDGGAERWREGRWSTVVAQRTGPPPLELASCGVLGDLARAAADFRDEYYGIATSLLDARDGDAELPRLVTSGLIDPARCRWGAQPARIAHRRLRHPRADLTRVSHALRRWAAARLVPKVVLATQTRILEAAVDADGAWLPVVPVISVMPVPAKLWDVAAVLLAPPIASHARRLHAGAALSADAIKLSARQVAALPLPAERDAWAAGAQAALRATVAASSGDEAGWRSALDALGEAMCEAYGIPVSRVMGWWSERLDLIGKRAARLCT